ncbi:MAG: hypothetical protein DCC55_04825 [Chloroflexi bacterium]|nr:MAG: hypothetical protein DCC55_04825 [Chloroflexota bacterium]
MHAYEFSTEISDTGQVEIPAQIAARLPVGASVRILVLVDEIPITTNGHAHLAEGHDSALEELIAEIKRTPSKPENIRPGDGLLAWRLAHPVTEPDPDFDEAAWNKQWDEIEAAMKAQERAHEQEELRELLNDLTP